MKKSSEELSREVGMNIRKLLAELGLYKLLEWLNGKLSRG